MSSIRREMSHPLRIRSFQPGDISYMACLHARVYVKEYGLDPIFEKSTLPDILDFLESKPAGNIWVAESGNRIVGFIGIIGTDSVTAQLRWFLVDCEFRGMGLGRRLMTLAMDYCREKGIRNVYLWTFSELEIARHLYQTFGFSLTEKVPRDNWKKGLVDERWDLDLGD